MTEQLVLFGAQAGACVVTDLEGLLAGGGQVVRLGGTARISIVVRGGGRARVLLAELARRNIAADVAPATLDGHFGVRTAFSAALAPLAATWLRGAVKRPPPGFAFDGAALRLWVVAGGSPEPGGYVLRLTTSDEPCWHAVGAALTAMGLPAKLLTSGAARPVYRISGRRRLAWLRELVGESPAGWPVERWP